MTAGSAELVILSIVQTLRGLSSVEAGLYIESLTSPEGTDFKSWNSRYSTKSYGSPGRVAVDSLAT